ncbi:MAG TPA: thiamine-phosphate pyrophosphorylase [bacterium]|nr:thiamine-phosphate pyrophosphorylase [bacterium]HPN31016.1 thiamine-phosphate pyrophosphorylase [bacterium]
MEPVSTDILRIIDANYNRINEGLRVIEEYYRFISPNSELQKQLKEIRHNLFSEIHLKINYTRLLENRDSANDLGAEYSTQREVEKNDLKEILISNFKRVQESFRVLEEYSKLVFPESSPFFKKFRFQIYELEKKQILEMKV